MPATLAQTLWLAACAPEWLRFQQAAQQVERTQTAILQGYWRTNASTAYGQQFDFATINTITDYQKRVPLTTYDDYATHIERAGQGAANVLTTAPIKRFEPSSGSTTASKLIPYTAPLQAEFQRGIAPWIFDLYTHDPALLHGPAYWSLSPLTDGARTTPGGIPIGFEDDSAYLGGLGQVLANTAFAVPSAVKHLRDMATFRYVTILCLLHQRELRLISVWNPTFLTLLLAPLEEWWAALLNDIERGSVTPPGEIPPEVRRRLARALHPNPKRAAELRRCSPTDYVAIWPQLRLLSCWTDAAAATPAHQLAAQFPGVRMQGKGLLATEAFVSFPLVNVEGAVLAVRSHFFEFLSTTTGAPYLAHQLEKGHTYEVVLTTSGGFYRYRLRDVVEVLGHWAQAPRLRFVGKTDHVADFFGEKLEEQFVARVLQTLFAQHGLTPTFALLAPDERDSFGYTLYLEATAIPASLAAELDTALCANFHYDYCRRLGQLAPARVYPVVNAASAYLTACVARGQKLGNIKPSVLQKTTGWAVWFTSATESFSQATKNL